MDDLEVWKHVKTIISRNRGKFPISFSYDELCSEGYIQALQMIDKYDPNRNCKLLSYLYKYLPYRIMDGIMVSIGWRINTDPNEQGGKRYKPKAGHISDEAWLFMSYNEEETCEFPWELLTEAQRHFVQLRARGNSLQTIGNCLGYTDSNASLIQKKILNRIT